MVLFCAELTFVGVFHCSQITADEAVFVLTIVRSLEGVTGGHSELLKLVLLPSIVTKSAPSNMKIALAEDPDIVGVAPSAGFIVRVLEELTQANWGITIGKISEVEVYVPVMES